jgi:hypothetical protein
VLSGKQSFLSLHILTEFPERKLSIVSGDGVIYEAWVLQEKCWDNVEDLK